MPFTIAKTSTNFKTANWILQNNGWINFHFLNDKRTTSLRILLRVVLINIRGITNLKLKIHKYSTINRNIVKSHSSNINNPCKMRLLLKIHIHFSTLPQICNMFRRVKVVIFWDYYLEKKMLPPLKLVAEKVKFQEKNE